MTSLFSQKRQISCSLIPVIFATLFLASFLFPYTPLFAQDDQGVGNDSNAEIISQDYSFPEQEFTIRSKESGGFWSDPNTWKEGRVPNKDDIVEVNGIN